MRNDVRAECRHFISRCDKLDGRDDLKCDVVFFFRTTTVDMMSEAVALGRSSTHFTFVVPSSSPSQMMVRNGC